METRGTLELQKSKLEDILILIEHLENITHRIARKSYIIHFLYYSASFGSVSILTMHKHLSIFSRKSLDTFSQLWNETIVQIICIWTLKCKLLLFKNILKTMCYKKDFFRLMQVIMQVLFIVFKFLEVLSIGVRQRKTPREDQLGENSKL